MLLRSKNIVFALLISAVAAISATADYQQMPAPPKPQNLKVLPKNISHEELDHIMDEWKVALGVKCNFCHAASADNPKRLNFASDAKPEKDMARQMYTMTAKINKKYFHASKMANGMMAMEAVNCVTCHHGEPHPEVKEDKEMKQQK